MIAHLNGKLVSKDPSMAIIECNGVGYEVKISLNTSSKIGDKEQVKLFTRMIVREDAQILFGFFEEAEKVLFDQLISVQGVGGNTGLTILSSISPSELDKAIASENIDLLKRIKGIGPKTAGRIILELKGKLKMASETGSGKSGFPLRQEAIAALTSLGFPRGEMEKRVDQIISSSESAITVEDIIKKALRGG